jgi:hypothetical protein
MRFGGDPSALGRLLAGLPGAPASALARARLDLHRGVLALLAPGISVSLSLAPTFDVARFSRARTGNPFDLVHLTAAAEVKDPVVFARAHDRLAGSAPGLGVRPCKVRGLPGWRIAVGDGEVVLALQGKRLLVASGPGRLESLLFPADRGTSPRATDRAQRGTSPRAGEASAGGARYAGPGGTAPTVLRGGGMGGVIDFRQLVGSFRALPPSAYGSGPDAFVMRSLAERVVEPASRLEAASLRLDVVEAAVRIEAVVEAREAPQGAQPAAAGRDG